MNKFLLWGGGFIALVSGLWQLFTRVSLLDIVAWTFIVLSLMVLSVLGFKVVAHG